MSINLLITFCCLSIVIGNSVIVFHSLVKFGWLFKTFSSFCKIIFLCHFFKRYIVFNVNSDWINSASSYLPISLPFWMYLQIWRTVRLLLLASMNLWNEQKVVNFCDDHRNTPSQESQIHRVFDLETVETPFFRARVAFKTFTSTVHVETIVTIDTEVTFKEISGDVVDLMKCQNEFTYPNKFPRKPPVDFAFFSAWAKRSSAFCSLSAILNDRFTVWPMYNNITGAIYEYFT